MTDAQAKQLGLLLTRARTRKGLSIRGLAAQAGVSFSWLAKLEAGQFTGSSSMQLSQIASVLNIDPTKLDRLTKGAVQAALPEPRVYFRSKLAMTPEETDRVMKYIERMRRAA